MSFFTPEHRAHVRDALLAHARSDARITAAAEVGSFAAAASDRWSDLDLTFAIPDRAGRDDIVADWTARLRDDHGARVLFDVTSGPSLYRVYLLPGSLQVDLSWTPQAEFGPRGPHFDLLFGEVGARSPGPPAPPVPETLYGHAVHHALRARFSLERGKLWQAEYWLSETRNAALSMSCLRCGHSPHHGRGLDALPEDVREAARGALARALEPTELQRALSAAIALVIGEADAAGVAREELAEALDMLSG